MAPYFDGESGPWEGYGLRSLLRSCASSVGNLARNFGGESADPWSTANPYLALAIGPTCPLYWKETTAEKTSTTPSRGVALKTFSNFGKSERFDRDDFERLHDENAVADDSQKGIVRDWEVRVSVETSRERGTTDGYSAKVQA